MANKKIGIVMGSDSDLITMKEAIWILREFEVDCDVHVMSAHRSPEIVHTFAVEAEKKYEVIIAAAGGAAHLAGVIASLTPIPVIGVPIQTSGLGGLDSLLSTVQMPAGIPVATLGIGKSGAVNAALLAVQIISTSEPKLRQKFVQYKKKLAEEVVKKDKAVQVELGLL
jgi:5-(carboxyamino)imidazole ribonucleotide mutase